MPFNPRASKSFPKPLYFKNLLELDEYQDKRHERWEIQNYVPRSEIAAQIASSKGKLLVCHDYKGGYTESPTDLAYTFNFWSSCDTFIYFSHHRVTIPPPGWITAAHRQGVKILGTLIFESGAEEDCLRLLVGRTPSLSNQHTSPAPSIPLSSHYAKSLARLTAELGFDGWLLNFECPLMGGPVQMKVLSAWIAILRKEMKEVVGEYAQVNWYDSVIFTGQLRWQDRLNKLNLPFFLASDTFFTNYTWPPHFPALTTQYFLSIDQALLTSPSTSVLQTTTKNLQDIFFGVDVWGRGSHGGGGFGCYKAIEHIQPQDLGLSVALFGQAWTWESEQDKEGWNWEKWWSYERALWVGPAPDPLPPSPSNKRVGEPECEHGSFRPVASFFPHHPPPNPVDLPFWMTFSPGVGRGWFIGGRRVLESGSEKGWWTDIDKQTSLGDMVWPKTKPTWVGFGDEDEDFYGDELPDVESGLCFEDAWLGGSSLKLKVKSREVLTEESFRCFQIPINSLALSPRVTYVADMIYKVLPNSSGPNDLDLELDVGCSVKILSNVGLGGDGKGEVKLLDLEGSLNMNLGNNDSDNNYGWTRTSIKFTIPADYMGDFIASVGVQLGFMTPPGASSYALEILIGQISVYQSPPEEITPPDPRILYAEFDQQSSTLRWGTGLTLDPPNSIDLSRILPDDPNPVWILDRTRNWQPIFLYFNIYTQLPGADGLYDDPIEAKFYGTTALHDGTKLVIDPDALGCKGGEKVRFHIQGVTDRGTILEFSKCCYVDVTF